MAKMIKINFSSKDKVIKFNDIGEKPLNTFFTVTKRFFSNVIKFYFFVF